MFVVVWFLGLLIKISVMFIVWIIGAISVLGMVSILVDIFYKRKLPIMPKNNHIKYHTVIVEQEDSLA